MEITSYGTFDEMIMMSALYYTYMLSWIFIVLARSTTGRHVALLGHIIPDFKPTSLLFLLNSLYLAENEQILIL